MDVDDIVREICAIADPAARAKRASEVVVKFQAATTEVSRVRREALDELLSQGMTHAEIAAKIGMTRARVGQLLSSGPSPERIFLGPGPTLTVAMGGKWEQGRRDKTSQPLVSAEAVKAYEAINAVAQHLGLRTQQEVVPPPGMVNLNRAGLIVMTSPKLLPFVSQVLDSDQRYGFAEDDDGCWYLIDKETGADYRAPQDVTGEPCDYAYLGRLPRPDGKGSFLYLAGIHSLGTLGAARYLDEHLVDLYRDLKTRRFSLLLQVRYDPKSRAILSATGLTPLHRHEGV